MLGGTNTQPVTVGLLSFMGTNEIQWGLMAAATVIAIIPEMILYLSVQTLHGPRSDLWRGEVKPQEGTMAKVEIRKRS